MKHSFSYMQTLSIYLEHNYSEIGFVMNYTDEDSIKEIEIINRLSTKIEESLIITLKRKNMAKVIYILTLGEVTLYRKILDRWTLMKFNRFKKYIFKLFKENNLEKLKKYLKRKIHKYENKIIEMEIS